MSLALRPMELADLDDVMQVEIAGYSIPWSASVMKGCIRMGYDASGRSSRRGHSQSRDHSDHGRRGSPVEPVRASCFSRRGYGKAMLEHVIERAQELGAHRMILEVRPSNKGAIKLYYALGFERIGVRKGYYPGPEQREDAWVLSCTFNSYPQKDCEPADRHPVSSREPRVNRPQS